MKTETIVFYRQKSATQCLGNKTSFRRMLYSLSHSKLKVFYVPTRNPHNRGHALEFITTIRAFQRAQEHLSSLSGSRDSHTPYFWVFASYPLWVWGMGVATYQNAHRTSRPFQRAQEHLSTTSGGFKNYVAKISMVMVYGLWSFSFVILRPYGRPPILKGGYDF